jgi:pectate lyase
MSLLASCSSGTQASSTTKTGGNIAPSGGTGGTGGPGTGGAGPGGTTASGGQSSAGGANAMGGSATGGVQSVTGGASGSLGGAPGTGGSSTATGGVTSTGGATGGAAGGGTVGDAGQGGATGGTALRDAAAANGGTTGATGGNSAAGGTQATGGAMSTGGNVTGGTKSTGGTSSTGGSVTGGTTSVDGCAMDLVGWATVEGDGLKTTTGGGNATPQRVTTLADFKSLAGDNTARVIEISGTIDTGTSPVDIASNKTIVGVNKSSTIKGGINIREGSSNIIVRNLNIQGKGQGNDPVDTVAARGSHHLWFDHLNISDASDGNLDLTKGSNYLTVSWSRFSYTDPNHTHRLSCLVGAGSTEADTDMGKNNVTYHHNWFAELVDQRMPRVLFGKGHVFNSYYTSSGNGYCVGTGSYASVLVEGNYFKNVKSPHRFQDTNPSYITARDNVYDNTTGNQDTGLGGTGGSVTPFTDPPYDYALDKTASIPDLITRCAGPR